MNKDIHASNTVAGRTDAVSECRRSLWKGPAFITAIILLIPLLGNHFVDGWNWNFGGFVAAGTLIFGTGLMYKLVTRNAPAIAYRIAVGIALVASFFLFWGNFIQVADDINPAAMMYFVTPFVGIIGAAMARLKPNGMARALFATAFVQALVLVIVLIIRNPQVTHWSWAVLRGFGLNALLVLLFFGSALLFRKAGRVESGPGAV